MRHSRPVLCVLLVVATGCSVRVRSSARVSPIAQPLDTTDWVTFWSDDFNRTEPGANWKAIVGQVSMADGALNGVFARDPSVPFAFYSADLAPEGRALPDTVEIRYECWSPADVGSEAKLLDGAGMRGLVMALYGTPHPALKSKAAAVFAMTGPNRFDTVAANEQFVFTPHDHHKVRIVRQPEGVTVFVDGGPATSAAMGTRPELREPNLHLAGTFGKEGIAIFFDNLEIRVPAGPKVPSR